MAVRFKQKCFRCKSSYVLVSRGTRFPICYDCQKDELVGEIKDPEMKKMFAIPEEFYVKNNFLRDIKIKYLKFGDLTENQIKAFKKVSNEMKEAEKEENKQQSA